MRKLLSATGVAVALAVAAAGPAAAQSQAHRMYFVPQSGPVMTMDELTPAKLAMLMKHARKLPAGSIVYTTPDGLYVAEDGKMDDGKMLSDALMH